MEKGARKRTLGQVGRCKQPSSFMENKLKTSTFVHRIPVSRYDLICSPQKELIHFYLKSLQRILIPWDSCVSRVMAHVHSPASVI